MTGRFFLNTARNVHSWLICSCIVMTACNAHADTVSYTLDNIVLDDGEPITGAFEWTFTAGDFEGGMGEFTAIEIPHTIYSFADGNLNIEIQTDSIEISGNGNYHDVGLDITLRLSQPLSLTQSVPIVLDLPLPKSFFECCGNGFNNHDFISGSISPTLTGDYNGNNIVDAADYSAWRDALTAGATSLLNDPTPSTVDESDFTYWRDHFGETLGSGAGAGAGANAAVPEPATLVLMLLAPAGWCLRRARSA